MSRQARIKHRLKTIGKEWTGFREVAVTDEIRNSAPHMKFVGHIYANSRFEVHTYTVKTPIGGVTQVVIARHHHLEEITWNDCERIKLELFGAEAEAVEIYPKGIVPSMKIRILWVLPAGYVLPFGLDKPGAWGDNV